MTEKTKPTGYVVVTTLVFSGVFLMILYSLLGLVFTQYERQRQIHRSKESLQIAEAGLDWYRWYLAHNPGDVDGPDDSMPYKKPITDPERGEVGTATLDVSGSSYCGQNQWIDIKSTGRSKENTDLTRTVKARYLRPSVGRYAYILNSNVWAGDDRSISGPYHSNGGIRMDANHNSTVSSAREDWECSESFGCETGDPGVRKIIVGEYGDGERLGTSDTIEALSPKRLDLTDNGNYDVAYVDSNQRIRLTDEQSNPETLITSADIAGNIAKEKTRLWTGDWEGYKDSVFFVNENKDRIYSADKTGSVTEVAVPSDGAQAVVGAGDIDDDGTDEMVFSDSSQQLRYIEPDGSVKKVDNGQLGSNDGIGAGGGLGDFPGSDVTDSVVAVDGSNTLKVVNDSETFDGLAQDAAKSPPAAADVDADSADEVVYLSTDGILKYVDNVGASNEIKILNDKDGDTISGSADTGITSARADSSGGGGTVTKPGVFGDGSNPELWEFPVPQIDFAGITMDLDNIRETAKNQGTYFPANQGKNSKGYRIVLNGDQTIDVYRVRKTEEVWGYSNQRGWHKNEQVIKNENFDGTYTLSDDCPVVFSASKLWLEGDISNKITVAAAKPKNPNTSADIIINDNIEYQKQNGAGLTAISERSVFIPLMSPDNMIVNGIFIAQNGHFGRDHYEKQYVQSSREKYVKRDELRITGSIVSNDRVGTQWVDDDGNRVSGYKDRVNTFDRDQAIRPPPFTPFVTEEYELIRWQEVR